MRSFRYTFRKKKDAKPEPSNRVLFAAGAVLLVFLLAFGLVEFGFHLW